MSDLRLTTGLVSGIDYNELITKLTATEQNKIDMKVKQRTLVEWKREAFRNVNTKLLALRSSVSDMKLESTYSSKKATSSNESILTATATTQATNDSYYIEVKQLAQKVTLTSQSALGSNEDLSSLAAQLGIDDDAVINFTLGGVDGEIPFSFTAGTTKMSDVVRIINAEEMGITATYDTNLDRFFLNTSGAGTEGLIEVKMDGMTDSDGDILYGTDGTPLSFLSDYLKLNLNTTELNETSPASGRKISSDNALIIHDASTITLAEMYESGTEPASISFTLEGDDGSGSFTFSDLSITLQDFIDEINDQTLDTGVTASYDSDTGKVLFSTGDQVTVSDDTEGFLEDKLNMLIGTWQTTIDSNTSIRVADPANISLAHLYTSDETPASVAFNLEGSLGDYDFSFATGTTTVQQMIDMINTHTDDTGITASYDGDTGKISFSDSCPVAALQSGSSATNASLTFNEALYYSSDGTPDGTLTALTNGQDISASFTYTGSGALTSATYQSSNGIDFVVAGAADGDTITFDDGLNAFFDAEGNEHIPVTMTYNGSTGEWEYDSRLNTDRKIEIHYDSEGFLGDELNISMYSETGQKAIIDFNDAENLEFDSNEIGLLNDTINLDLHSASVGQIVELDITSDIDKAIEKIKAFIEVYNTTIVYMNQELTATKYTNRTDSQNYEPLTAAEKEDMTEEEIEAWEAKAKSGMLRGDSILFSAYSTIRQAVSDPVEGLDEDSIYTSLSSLGINTASYVQSSLEGGKLYIDDENALREALEDNTEEVMNLFTLNEAVTETVDEEVIAVTDWNGNDLYNKGVAVRLYDLLTANMTTISDKAGSSSSSNDTSLLSKEISRINETITALEEHMEEVSDRYYTKLIAMEQMLSYYNSQSSWLAEQVASLTANSSNN